MSILVVLAVCIFVLAFMGFGVDMTNLFFHRESAQGAADSACVATAMDVFVGLQGTSAGGFTPGSAFNCTSSSTQAPCKYAKLNGYSSPGLTANTASNLVAITFPGAVSGAVAPAASTGATWPFIEATVTDRVPLFFSSLLTRNKTQDVHAIAKCGLQSASSTPPMLVLDPTDPTTFDVYGTPNVVIAGGPNKSIQVNSNNTAAVNIQGSATVNLTAGGPAFNGSSFGVFGGPGTPPGGFSTSGTGAWQSPAAPVLDPFAGVPAPPNPGAPKQLTPNQCMTSGVPCNVNGPGGLQKNGATACAANGCDGCPDPSGCQEYFPGDYVSGGNNGIDCKNATCIFAPGVYYVGTNGMNFDSNSIVRPTDVTQSPGDGSMGTLFYMTCSTPGSCSKGEAGVSVAANSGKKGPSTCPAAPGAFQCYPTSNAVCPGGSLPTGGNPPIPTYVPDSVLVGPCTTNAEYDTPPASLGKLRGMVFYADRSGAGTDDFSGGGGLLLVGTLYVHDCPNSPTCVAPTGSKSNPGDYQSSLVLGGNSGEGTYLIGFIVADQLAMHGTPTIAMYLSPSTTLSLLKVALLQ
ncbi:MAG TPA: pilus assembly protein TadG-related protein [Terriglobia bacterium]|nr:pilus assembly protein TadG-related protein [Terriglobia bacterium]